MSGRCCIRSWPFVPMWPVCTRGEETAPLEIFSPPWLFTAIVVALGSSALFRCLVKLKPLRNRQYTEGADVLFNRAITAIWPAVLIVALFAALNVLLSEILGTTALHNVASDLFMTLFEQVGRNFGRGAAVYPVHPSPLVFWRPWQQCARWGGEAVL